MVNDRLTRTLLLLMMAILLVLLAFMLPSYYLGPVSTAHAQGAQFDYVALVSPLFLYKGQNGLLLLDKRNGNVWFMPKRDDFYQDPVFITRVPFEKLDRQP